MRLAALVLVWTGEMAGQEFVCVSATRCVPWAAACAYARLYCIDGRGSSCGAVAHLCNRTEDSNWCSDKEVWERCWSAAPDCEPRCDALALPHHCTQQIQACQASRCVCKESFRRDSSGHCQPAYKCQRCRWVSTADSLPLRITPDGARNIVGTQLRALPNSSLRAAQRNCRLTSRCNLILRIPFLSLHTLFSVPQLDLDNATLVQRPGYSFYAKRCRLLSRENNAQALLSDAVD